MLFYTMIGRQYLCEKEFSRFHIAAKGVVEP
jgi:hypothetical protein